MKRKIHIILIVLFGVSIVGLLSGCAIHTKEGVARSTTEFNLVAEKVGNEMLLLNIIRASKRRPMYFTSISKLTREMTFEYGTGGVSIPFGRIGGGLNGSYSVAPSASFNDSPVLDVSVLDKKEFTNGIMRPVPMEIVEYFWSMGWHKEMLLHLFIRRIEIGDPEDPNIILKEYVNYPGDWYEFKHFQEQIQEWEWGIEEKVIARSEEEFEANKAKSLRDLKELIEAQKVGLKLKPVKDNQKKKINTTSTEKADANDASKLKKKKLCLNRVEYVFTREKEGKKETFDELHGTIYLRSPEAILYYLGEILRAEIRGENKEGKPNPYIPIIQAGLKGCKGTKNWLFYARKATKEDKIPSISVDYEGITYVIPGRPDTDEGCCTDRSMHVMSLVSLLIGLQKESELVPTTATVSVIGQ